MPARLSPLNRVAPAHKESKVPSWIDDPAPRLAACHDVLDDVQGLVEWEGKRDGLTVLILTILSQNTTDGNALRAYQTLCERFPSLGGNAMARPDALPRLPNGEIDPVKIRLSQAADALPTPDWRSVMASSERELMDVIRVAGLPNSKAPAILRVLQWLAERNPQLSLESALAGKSVDEIIDILSSIKGVGEKTVTVTLIEAWGADLCPVDTHVHRVVQRLGLVPASQDRVKTFHELRKIIQPGRGFSLHHQLLTFGRTTCNARSPHCGHCPLLATCPTGQETQMGAPGAESAQPRQRTRAKKKAAAKPAGAVKKTSSAAKSARSRTPKAGA